MTPSSVEIWNAKFAKDGHTGYHDHDIYEYDQPLRIRIVRQVLMDLHPAGLAGLQTLDVGCGTGDFIDLLLNLGAANVQGIDVSASAASLTADRFASHGSRVAVRAADVTAGVPPMAPRDLITCVTVLQHVIDDRLVVAAMTQLRALLKPDGLLLALEIAPHRSVPPSDPATVRERTVMQWRAIFEEAGFEEKLPMTPYSPLGFLVVQIAVPRLIRTILGHRMPSTTMAPKRAALHVRLYRAVRRLLLRLCYPYDHVLHGPTPRAAAYYHVFVLGPAARATA